MITFGVDQSDPGYFPNATDVVLDVTITPYDANLKKQTPIPIKININYHPLDGLLYIDKSSYIFRNAYKITYIINSISINGKPSNVLPANLYLDADIQINRYYDFSSDISNKIIVQPVQALDVDCDPSANPDELLLTWNTMPGVENYELEWTYVNDYGSQFMAGPYINPSELKYDFKNNSSRVMTTENYFTINLNFDHGYILYRVRGIGNDLSNPPSSLQNLIFGVWSVADYGKVSDVLSYSYFVSKPNFSDLNF